MRKKAIVISLLASLFFTSCISHQKFIYFQNSDQNSPNPIQEIGNQITIKIQPDDILAIRVSSFDAEAAAPFNLSSSNNQIRENNLRISDYLVDKEGNIDFPGLGQLQIAGLTVTETKELLLEKLSPFLNDPIVNVRFINFRVNVLGEVQRPGAYTITDESFTIIEALTQAGDVSDFGNREDIQIIREQDGKREFGSLNLLSSEIFDSPFYYLRQNDIVYVPPTKGKTTTVASRPFSSTIFPLIGVTISLTSFIISISR